MAKFPLQLNLTKHHYWSESDTTNILCTLVQWVLNRLHVHCKKGMVVLTQFGCFSFLLSACVVEHSGVPLPALDSKQIKKLSWLSKTLANVMGEYIANEIVQSCGIGYETEVTALG